MESENVIIHVRFAPNAAVVEIGDRPTELSPQDWFFFLSENAGNTYQPLSGGRGVFRLTRQDVDALKAKSVPSVA
jgi:hypothetical protein